MKALRDALGKKFVSPYSQEGLQWALVDASLPVWVLVAGERRGRAVVRMGVSDRELSLPLSHFLASWEVQDLTEADKAIVVRRLLEHRSGTR